MHMIAEIEESIASKSVSSKDDLANTGNSGPNQTFDTYNKNAPNDSMRDKHMKLM